jgi:hypothetical protein
MAVLSFYHNTDVYARLLWYFLYLWLATNRIFPTHVHRSWSASAGDVRIALWRGESAA